MNLHQSPPNRLTSAEICFIYSHKTRVKTFAIQEAEMAWIWEAEGWLEFILQRATAKIKYHSNIWNSIYALALRSILILNRLENNKLEFLSRLWCSRKKF